MARYQCADMLEDLRTVDKFLVSRLDAGACIRDLAKAQLESMKAKVKQLKNTTIDQLLELTQTVEGMDKVWSKQQQLELTTCLSNLVVSRPAPKNSGKHASDVFQSCMFQNYLDDWRVDKMQEQTTSRDGCISIVSECAKMNGILRPDEHAFGRMTACVAMVGLNDPHMDVQKLHTLNEDIKTEHRRSCENFTYPFSYLKNYPVSPTELDTQRLEFAFPHGANFRKMDLHAGGIAHICSQKYLRKTAAGIARSMPRQPSAESLCASPQATRREVPTLDLSTPPQVVQNPMQAMCQMMMMMMQQQQQPQGSQFCNSPIDASMAMIRRPVPALKDEVTPAPAVSAQSTGVQNTQVESDQIAPAPAVSAQSTVGDALADLREMQNGTAADRAAGVAKVI